MQSRKPRTKGRLVPAGISIADALKDAPEELKGHFEDLAQDSTEKSVEKLVARARELQFKTFGTGQAAPRAMSEPIIWTEHFLYRHSTYMFIEYP